MASSEIKQVLKTKQETLTANQWGPITPSIHTDRILSIRAVNSSLNLIILPIYNAEIKVYSIQNNTLVIYSGTISIQYIYF